MIDYITQNLWLLWLIVCFGCLITELALGDFFVTCLAIGAAVTVIASLFGIPFWAQVLVWVVFSVLSLWLVRPKLLKKLHNSGDDRKSNADALIGRAGTVSETIKSGEYGRVQIDGDDWKAAGCNQEDNIEKGEKVVVIDRESIILTVKKAEL